MKNNLLPFITLFAFIHPFMDVYATEINHSNQKQEHNEIYHLVTEHLKQKTDQQIFDATFELKKLSTHLKLPKCQNHLILKDRNPDSVSGRITLSVSCEHPKWRIFVPVTIKGKLPVIISTKGIPKQAVIKDRDVKKVLLPYQKVPKGYLMEVNNVIGMRTTKAIPPKKVLRIKDLQPPYWVFKNQQVNIITRIGGIEVKTIGKALKNGLEQEQVPVKNNSSQKVIKGIVIAPNTILIP